MDLSNVTAGGGSNVATVPATGLNDPPSQHQPGHGQSGHLHQSHQGHQHQQISGPHTCSHQASDQQQQHQQQMYQSHPQQQQPSVRDSNSSLGHHRHPSVTSVSSSSNPRLNAMSGSSMDLRFGTVNMNQSFPGVGMYSGAQVPYADPTRGYSYHDISTLLAPVTPATSSPMVRGLGNPMTNSINPYQGMNPMDMFTSSYLNQTRGQGMGPSMNQSFSSQVPNPMNPQSLINPALMNQSMMNPMAGQLPIPQPGMNPSYAANAALQNWLVQYNQWWHYVENRRREAIRMSTPAAERPRLTPHRFPHRHSRPSFGSKNELIITFGTSVFIQQIDPGLIDFGESVQVTTWPGPLSKTETNKDDVLEYIRLREASLKQELMDSIKDNDTVISEPVTNNTNYGGGVMTGGSFDTSSRNHEKKQIWLLLSMLVKQNGILSGPDITELLVSQNESDFVTDDDGSDLSQLRRYLMLGQRKTALEHAGRSGLWGHAFTLTFFTGNIKPTSGQAQISQGQSSKPDVPSNQLPPQSVPDPLMVSMIIKFMNTTIERDDPLSVLYRSLLSKITSSQANKSQANKVLTTDNLKQFSILLANDCEVGSVVSNVRSNELLKLIVSLRNHSTQSLVHISRLDNDSSRSSDEKTSLTVERYTDELVFVNEIMEYARPGTEFIEELVPLKLKLTTRLFDFGHGAATAKYCYAIKQYYLFYNYFFPGKEAKSSKLDWTSILSIVNDIECKLWGYDVTNGQYTPQKEEVDSSAPVGGAGDEVASPNRTNEDSGAEEEESESIDDEEEDDEPDSNVNVITNKFQQMRPLPTVPEVPIKRGHSGSNNRQEYGQRQQDRRDTISSDVSDSRSASPQKSSVQRTSSVSSANHNQRIQRSFSKESTTPPSTTPSPGHAPPVATFPAGAQSAKVSSSAFFMPTPVASDQPANFLSDPTQFKSNQEQNDNDESNEGRRDSMGYNHSGSFNNPAMNPVLNSTAAAGFGGIMAPRDTMGSPGLSAFSPISSPQMDTSEMIKPRSFSHPRNDIAQGTNGHPSTTQPNGKSEPENSKQNKSGWFGSIIAKVVPPGPVRAKLPDDSNPSIYYDEKLKRWIDKDNPDDGALMDAIANGPPKMPGMNRSAIGGSQMIGQQQPQPAIGPGPLAQPLSRSSMGQSMPSLSQPPLPGSGINGSTNEFSFVKRSAARPRYVDAWQQHQTQIKKSD